MQEVHWFECHVGDPTWFRWKLAPSLPLAKPLYTGFPRLLSPSSYYCLYAPLRLTLPQIGHCSTAGSCWVRRALNSLNCPVPLLFRDTAFHTMLSLSEMHYFSFTCVATGLLISFYYAVKARSTFCQFWKLAFCFQKKMAGLTQCFLVCCCSLTDLCSCVFDFPRTKSWGKVTCCKCVPGRERLYGS